ncbi:helix-turn-helix domain-containing protein [Microbispora sp. RL4-1S]|uniref:Helix-turn-helix domain-containing protein n=1 Tax=Microbispora oryzae TaxID=2806554 RepID=A0A940WLH9_9ACTN|nr:XRE family transcriptional regulator [Microbispora oryzae]MBP2707840.1 helix-turn-helix domain-containing protein [Microbispora oryzae]
MDPTTWPDPQSARDQTEFVDALRRLRTGTGLSYRELAKRAASAGESLPISTLSAALTRDSMPRPEVVRALVLACGGDEETVAGWLAVRSRLLAAPSTREPDAGSSSMPGEPPKALRRGRRGVLLAVLAFVLVVGAWLGGRWLVAGESDRGGEPERAGGGYPTPGPTDPAQASNAGPALGVGPYRVHVDSTGLCVGEGPELYKKSDRIVLGQHDCATAGPPITLEPVGGAVYRIILHHPQYGPGCMTVDLGGKGPGLLLAGGACEPDRPDQRFTIEASGKGDGYRIRSLSGPQYCVGVLEASREKGVQLVQQRCASGRHQVFTFERRDPPPRQGSAPPTP